MKLRTFMLLLLLPGILFAYSYRDYTHYSSIFQETRNFRVYYPPTYNASGTKTYPVIYYCHGCLGSYEGDQYGSYSSSGGYRHPYNCTAGTAGCDPVMNKPYNADFQMFVDSNDVIIVMVDGKLYGAGGCDVWVPYEYNTGWTGNEYRFGTYIRELINVVDSLYKTKASPQYRAISGLSMGGQASLYMAMFNPHLFRSASSFCYSCSFHGMAPPPNTTPTDPQQFWRNYRGLSMRTHANTQDYLGRYSQQMGVLLHGAGFDDEYHLADFWRHWACDVDSQFDFHMRTFNIPKPNAVCFSHTDMYPDFDVWGYTVKSGKVQEGWIILKDVCKSSFGIQTRYRLPYGKSLSKFPIKFLTPAIYQPNGSYLRVAYDYRQGTFYPLAITANDTGAITLTDSGGMGCEYGISGNGLEPAVTLLTDTINDCIYLRAGSDSALSFEMANLTSSPLTNVKVLVKTDNDFLSVTQTHATIGTVPALSKIRVDSLVFLNGTYARWQNIGYIRVKFMVGSDTLDKEHVIQVQVMDSLPRYDSTQVTVFDGYNTVSGNLDTGKLYSMYATYPYDDVEYNQGTSAAICPINGQNNPDIVFEDYVLWNQNRSREIVEAKFRLNRVPTMANPIVLPFMMELIWTESSPGSDKDIDENVFRYGKVVFPYRAISVEKGKEEWALPVSVSALPNPFNPVTRIKVSTPQGLMPQTMAIYSPGGRKLRTFKADALASSHFILWNGRDDGNRPLPSGVYIFRATVKARSFETKIVYLR